MVQADVTDTASLNRLAGEVRERCGRVQILVNCAGTTRFVPHADLDGLDDTTIDQIFQTNWRGPFATIRALKSLLLESPSPVIINISSIAAVSGIGSNVAYCASKAALNAMTVSLGRALAPHIRVVSVSPGLVDTEFIKGLSEQWRNEQVARTALGRLPTPEDVSRAVLAAATLECSTGCVISVDGGRLLS
jgi:NAD(P)-dependent dehydrogenase (short-subunit alcohol dehydrogenase family)